MSNKTKIIPEETRVLEVDTLVPESVFFEKNFEKNLVKRRMFEVEEHFRPWGYFVILAEETDHKVKRLVLYPGKRLSLQRHQRREEHWYVLHGKAKVELDREVFELHQGDSINVPRQGIHRLENPGSTELVLIEIQRGDYFGEDDIERFEDDYGRI